LPQFLKLFALAVVATLFSLSGAEATLRLMGWDRLQINENQLDFWTHDPLLGWAPRPGQEGVFSRPQFETHVRINRKGLRDSEHSYERPGDTKRVLVIGDSFAWGFGVEHAERFSELLEDRAGIEVINAGASGYGTDQELLWLRSEGVKYDFDLLLLVFCGNDDFDNHWGRQYIVYSKPRFELDADTLVLRGVPVPEPSLRVGLERFLAQHSALVYALARETRGLHGKVLRRSSAARTVHTKVLGRPLPPSIARSNEVGFALTRALINEISSIANARDAGFMIAATRTFWMDAMPQGDGQPGAGTYQDLMERLRSDGHLLLELESSPEWAPDRMAIPGDGHWNRHGHEFVASELQRFIEEHRLLEGTRPQALTLSR
jgi:hypothetical protein